MDLKTELASNQTVLLLIPSGDYNSVMIDTLKNLSGNICYITANKTFDSLKETFVQSKVNVENIIFIDAISKTIKKVSDQSDSVYYVSSPGALTELSVVIEKFLKHKFDYLVFDSLNNLVIYNKVPICAKFLTSLISKIKKTKTKAIFYALGESNEPLTKHAIMSVDKLIDTLKNVEKDVPKSVPKNSKNVPKSSTDIPKILNKVSKNK